ncbi:MAG TPA: 3-dehydroquinate synthase [Clostridia bacterium]|nr:3-dehydroquinate synthase [Clostridia bacterium]
MSNIVLIGFMGTGKSTIGRVLAQLLGYEFIDVDTEIEKKEGQQIKEIFSQHGESYFRELESQVISDVSNRCKCVISTGGGVVLSPLNMEALRRNGKIICLKAKPEVILERVGKTGKRPLLDVEDPCQAINRILDNRKGLYNGDLSIDTSYMSPEDAAVRIKAFVSSEKQGSSFSMEFDNASCEVVSGSHLIEDLHKYIGTFYPAGKVLIVSNPTIYELWGSKLQAALEAYYTLDWCLIPDGEEYKNIDSLAKIYDKAVEMKLTRDSLMIGFGGGVIGDMTGFAAATYMRGIPYIQIPTTLLSQTDSSIGGKTAINHRESKNLIGSFYQPRMVIADTSTLVTLSPRELRSGLAEVIKYGVIGDYEFFEYLENNIADILKLDSKFLSHIIQNCCKTKASVVQLDEKDTGIRMLLNYGHTIGHAIEAATEYTEFRHGEAVSLGMEGAAYIAVSMGLMKEDHRTRQSELLAKAGLPTCFPGMDIDKVLYLMNNDKKVEKGRIRFVLPKALGSAEIYDNIPADYVRNALKHLSSSI